MTENRNIEELRSGFEDFYQNVLKPQFEDLEKSRKKYLKYFYIALVLSIIAVPAVMIYFLPNQSPDTTVTIPTDWVMGGIAVIFFIVSTPIQLYKRKAKKSIMPEFVKYFGDFTYKFQSHISDTTIKTSKLFKSYNQHIGDDYFVGKYKNVEMVVSEEELNEIIYQDNKKKTKDIFHGNVILLSMNKNFEGQTIVIKDAGLFNFANQSFGLQKIALEDSRFEKEFEVYGSDQLETRYLLTTAFMERILKLREVYKSHEIKFSFFENKLLIAIQTKGDMFETNSLFRSCTDKKMLMTAFEQFLSIMAIIDILKLDKRLGM